MAIDQNNSTSKGSTQWTAFDPKTGAVVTRLNEQNTSKVVQSRIVRPDRRPKPKGWAFPSAYERREVIENYPRGRVTAILKSGSPTGRKISGVLSPSYVPGPMFAHRDSVTTAGSVNVDMISQAEAKALTRLLTHGKDRDSTWKPGVAWRERKETADMLADTARTLVQTMVDLRKGNWRRAFGLVGETPSKGHKFFSTEYWKWFSKNRTRSPEPPAAALASGYLALQNGWKPLLGDISNAAEALAHRDVLADWVVTGIGTYDLLETGTVNTKGGSGYASHPSASLEWVHRRRVKVRIDATVSDQWLHTQAQLGLNNPAYNVWETIPLSYILDYFVAVGNWLEALGAPDGMKFYSGSRTVVSDYTSENRCMEGDGSWFGNARYFHMVRTPLSAFPVPIAPLSLKPEPIGLSQLANILSVGYLNFKGQNVPYSKMG